MEIKISRGIIEPLNKWLVHHGFEVECKYSKNGAFQYDPNCDIIIIPGTYDDDPDSLFMKCLRGLGLTSNFDTLTYSFLHELGHSQTTNLFTTKESQECDAIKDFFSIAIDEDDDDFYLKYWEVRDEKLANKWAVTYADTFPYKAQKIEEIIEKYVKFG